MQKALPIKPLSSFGRIERSVQRLRTLFLVILVSIVILPPSFFFFRAARHQQEITVLLAGQLALKMTNHMSDPSAHKTFLPPMLQQEMTHGRLLFVQGLGKDGKVVFTLGKPIRQFLRLIGRSELDPPLPPIYSISIQRDAWQLYKEGIRIFGIHCIVASILALIMYQLPLKALNQAIREARATQAQIFHTDKLATVGRVYAGLTHEINNPLSIVLTRVRLLIEDVQEGPPPSKLLEDLETIERHANRIGAIVKGFLSFVRDAPLEMAKTDLNTALRDALSFVGKSFGTEGVQVKLELAESLPALLASQTHLEQLFVNLIGNAKDAMPDGGMLSIKTACAEGNLITEIQDTGTGIAPEFRSEIFQPLFTTKDVGRGTGLGLTVSYGIVKAHGGNIVVESEPGRGSIFRVTLPFEGAGA